MSPFGRTIHPVISLIFFPFFVKEISILIRCPFSLRSPNLYSPLQYLSAACFSNSDCRRVADIKSEFPKHLTFSIPGVLIRKQIFRKFADIASRPACFVRNGSFDKQSLAMTIRMLRHLRLVVVTKPTTIQHLTDCTMRYRDSLILPFDPIACQDFLILIEEIILIRFNKFISPNVLLL